MKLLTVKNWDLIASEEIWGLLPFKKILVRDKTKQKEKAHKELLFIYFYCDIKSHYLLLNEENRCKEIKKDIGLEENWVIDDVIQNAIDFYLKFESPVYKLYKQTLKSASEVGNYLENTKELLEERDIHGKPVTDISKITNAIDKVPKLMFNLKSAYKEVIKEQEDNENKNKGKQSFNIFEQGLSLNE